MTDENNIEPAAENHEHGGELDQLMELVNQYARPVLIAILVVLVLSVGLKAYRQRKLSQEQEALAELSRARATSDLQSWVERFPKTDVAPLARLRLASAHYADGHFSQAINEYTTFLNRHPDHIFAPAAELGKCHALEAKGETDTALAGFDAFLVAHESHFLRPEAIIGRARCLSQQKRYDDARIACEDLMASKPDSEWSMRAEQTLRIVNRMEKGIVPSPPEFQAWPMPETEAGPVEVIDIPAPTATATDAVADATSETNQPTTSD